MTRTQLPLELLGFLSIFATSAALAGEPTIVRLGDTAVAEVSVRQAILRCTRDATELPLRECVQRYQVPLWRLDREAALGTKSATPTRRVIENRVLAERLIEALMAESAPTDDAVKAYLDQHVAEFQTPERVRIFRILVETRADAERLIAELGRGSVSDFRAAARSHSLDRSSHERGGDLGFVAADGTTDVPGVQVDPALFAAARELPDGAFAPKPVAEGDGFAVIWRRGSLPARRTEAAEAWTLAHERLAELGAKRKLDELFASRPSERKLDLFARFRRPECRLFQP